MPFTEGGTLSELHDVAGDLERRTRRRASTSPSACRAVVAERFERYAVNGDRPS